MNEEMMKYIEYVVDDLGLPKHLKGYKDTIYCIDEKVLDENAKLTYIYFKVAKRLGVTGPSIERNIRHTVEWLYRNGDTRKMNKYFGSSMPRRNNLTNNQFIATLSMAAIRAKREVDLYANYRR